MKILYFFEEEGARIVVDALRHSGHSVVAWETRHITDELAIWEPAEVILLNAAGQDAFDIAAMVKILKAKTDKPIIVLTVLSQTQAFLEAGARLAFTKPIRFSELLQALQRLEV